MTQAIGAILVLFGAICWHIASGNLPRNGITDIWADFGKSMRGEG